MQFNLSLSFFLSLLTDATALISNSVISHLSQFNSLLLVLSLPSFASSIHSAHSYRSDFSHIQIMSSSLCSWNTSSLKQSSNSLPMTGNIFLFSLQALFFFLHSFTPSPTKPNYQIKLPRIPRICLDLPLPLLAHAHPLLETQMCAN